MLCTVPALPRFFDEQLSQASPDLMRGLLTTFASALLCAQADLVRGAGYGEGSQELVSPGNGYSHHDLGSSVRTLDIAVTGSRPGILYRIGCRSAGSGPSGP